MYLENKEHKVRMKISFENQIKIGTVAIYAAVIILLVGGLRYLVNFKRIIETQKQEIERYDAELSVAERLISNIRTAQAQVSLYATKDSIQQEVVTQNMLLIQQSIDSLMQQSVNATSRLAIAEMDSLMREKESIVQELNKVLIRKNILTNVDKYLDGYKRGQLQKIAITQRVVIRIKEQPKQDSIIVKPKEKKSFFKKLGSLFSSKEEEQDTIRIAQTNTPTITKQTESTRIENSLSPEEKAKADRESRRKSLTIKKFIHQASADYITQLVEIESNINSLISADQEISTRISDLLMSYYWQIINARFKEIGQNEELIERYNNYIFYGAIVALLPIVVSLLLILRSIQKTHRSRLAMERANIRTQQVMDSRHKLLIAVSHDIKTPLNSIMGTLELKKGHEKMDDETIAGMLNSGKHILALLNNLLNFSSIEQSKLTLQYAPFRLQEVCSDVRDMFQPLCERKGLMFNINTAFDKDLVINSDSLKLKQIIINLLSNAVKYTQCGSVSLSIKYTPNEVHIDIADTGVGIAQDKMDTLFEPFVRVRENSTLAEGMGFGLFVVKSMVELFGGSIQVKSSPKQGTSFSIVIPAEQVLCSTAGSQKHLLWVDDDTTLLTILQSITQNLGHQVTTCHDIAQLPKLLNENPNPHYVITDMEMGRYSGLDVLTIVRKHSVQIPVILMTAHSEMNHQQASAMGFDGFLTKPVTTEALSLLIGTTANTTTPDATSDDFKELRKILGDDEALIHVLSIFVENTHSDINLLQAAVRAKDFESAQARCHKMLPMLMQIAPNHTAISPLRKMDNARNAPYPNWTGDVQAACTELKALALQIAEKIKNTSPLN